jgi:hypothetical protein
MEWSIDHVFLATAAPDAAERELAAFGFVFSDRRVHRGQGTANAVARFENAYFELLHAIELAELRSPLVAPLSLDERIRWRETGACPFGVCLRRESDASAEASPLSTWDYVPSYRDATRPIRIVTPRAHAWEPLLFVDVRPRDDATKPRPSEPQRGARRTLTAVRIDLPRSGHERSAGLRRFDGIAGFSLREGSSPLLELEWDHGREGQAHRFGAELPLVVRW